MNKGDFKRIEKALNRANIGLSGDGAGWFIAFKEHSDGARRIYGPHPDINEVLMGAVERMADEVS